MLQAAGYKYEDLERQGQYLVVHSINCKYMFLLCLVIRCAFSLQSSV